MSELEIEGRRVALSSLERVLWPQAGFGKRDLIDYYVRVAPALLPHLAGRPLTLWRFPEGVHRRGWWQNECRGRPDWMATATLRGQTFCVVNDLPSLVWVANQGTVELHPFLSPAAEPDRPTALVFDLDPGPPADVVACCDVALRLREALDALSLASFPKTSGSVGLHVYVPLNGGQTYAQTKPFARRIATSLATEHPERVVATAKRSARAGKVLIDWLQNDATRSTVAPYSLRATPSPTVSTPVTWDEVEEAVATRRAELLTFTAGDALDRVGRLGDLFRAVLELTQALPA